MENISVQTDVFEAIGELSQCVTETDARNLTKEIVEMLGAESFVYLTLLPTDAYAPNDSFRFLIGCRPELCQIYQKRMWMTIDPFFEYARTNSAPTVGSKIKVHTLGQTYVR